MNKLIVLAVISVFIFACTLTNENGASVASSTQAIKTQQPANMPVASSTPSLLSSCYVQTNVGNGRLNLRAGPGTQYPVIIVMHEGDAFTASTSTPSRDWITASINDHQGWVNSHFIQCNNSQGGLQ